MPWTAALCKTRAFPEYLLYGHFVGRSPIHVTAHRLTTESPATSYWESDSLNSTALAAMVGKAEAATVALCIESFSLTPVSLIREVVGL